MIHWFTACSFLTIQSCTWNFLGPWCSWNRRYISVPKHNTKARKKKLSEADSLDVTKMCCIFPPAQMQMVGQHPSS